MLHTAFVVALLTPQDLLVSGYNSDAVHSFDLSTGTATGTLGALGGIPGAQSVRYGPDGDLYVVAEKDAEVLRFDGASGSPLGVFVGDDPLTAFDESGGLQAPTAAVFGPDGNFYVGDFTGDNVLRYDGSDGAFLDEFVAAGAGGIDGPDAGMMFGPDGDLYVPGFESNNVVRFDGETGIPIGDVLSSAGGASRPRGLLFRDDGWMYVASWGNNRVLRVPPGGGAAEVFATTVRPTGLEFDPATGDLLVASDQSSVVRRYSPDGAFLGLAVGTGSGVDGGTWLALRPDPRLRLDWLDPGAAGTTNHLSVRNATPSSFVLVALGTAAGSVSEVDCPNSHLGIASPTVVLTVSDAGGEIAIAAPLGSTLAGVTLHLQAFDVATCRSSWTTVVVL